MALGTIAPWLQLPDFISAAHAGASIGLQQRKAADDLSLDRAKLEQSAIEASGRLGLGYTETANAAKRAQAEQELAKATLALHQGRYSDLSKQAEERHQLGLDRLTALEDNRDTVNGLHQDQLDSLNTHRAEVDALRGTRTTGGSRSGTPAEKPYMVRVPFPGAKPEDKHGYQDLPSTDPLAQEYLRNKYEIPIPDAESVYQPPASNQNGETLPLPTVADSNAQAAAALQPRNQIYEGGKTDNPIFDPGTMPAETLAAPVQTASAKPVLTTGKKRFRFDPKTGKFDPVE